MYRVVSSGLSAIAIGCELGEVSREGGSSGSRCTTLPLFRSSSATADPFHKDTHARRPSLPAITAMGYVDGTTGPLDRSKRVSSFPLAASSSSTSSEYSFATRIFSAPSSPFTTVIPAGAGMALSSAMSIGP